jgi:extracellular elastinolytic metalloproteinase
MLLAGSLLAAAALAPPAFADLRTGVAERPSLDVRSAASAGPAIPQAGVAAAAADLRRELGSQTVVHIDPLSGTPRVVENLAGFLSPPASGAAPTIARGFLARHAALFGATLGDVAGLIQTRDYVDFGGTHHVSFAQRVNGVPIFQGGVKVNVTDEGQVANVLGSPVHDPGTLARTPDLSALSALGRALSDGGARLVPPRPSAPVGPSRATTFAGSGFDRASLVYFDAGHGLQLAWHTVAEVDSQHIYEDIVDATSGDLLLRQNIVDFAGLGSRWFYLPDYLSSTFPVNGGGLTAPNGAQPGVENFVGRGWLASNSTTLNGNNAHVYSDTNDDDTPEASDEIGPKSPGTDWNYGFNTGFTSTFGNCAPAHPCSWSLDDAGSWIINLEQNATQVFYYVNQFHDHLAAAPIKFDGPAGNFQADGGDAVQAEVDDGANLDNGRPDDHHIDNANMATPPDGVPPRMQMYLFAGFDGFVDSNGGDDASIVYHEYTHGLSHRLVTDPNNDPALVGAQANSMGEAWSDWYAMDFLVKSCTSMSTRTRRTTRTCSSPRA